ncbi:MAG: iron ABC transporter permease [Symbiobacteriaceae bacterium]|nr:iron ABC transporter permease [Symbiobacteriaceae bacterium]
MLLLPILFIYCLCVGKYPVTPGESLRILYGVATGATRDWTPLTESVVVGLRLPRILASMMVGGSLAISGATYQGIFKNPLVSPDFLGVSAGASIGAASAILLSLSATYIQLFAFCGGLVAVIATVTIPRLMRSESHIMLVLSGIIVGGLMSSIMGYIRYVADPTSQLAAITYWTMGSFSYIRMEAMLPILPVILIPLLLLLRLSWWIDILSLGEQEAKSLGANVQGTRYLAVACATLLTASSVCISGTIGWVGLVIPHFGRMLVGPSNPRLLPIAFLIGAIFLLVVDTVTRTITTAEMPISILTGLIGAPFYALLLYRQRKRLQ